jgi:hypothetical protein
MYQELDSPGGVHAFTALSDVSLDPHYTGANAHDRTLAPHR